MVDTTQMKPEAVSPSRPVRRSSRLRKQTSPYFADKCFSTTAKDSVCSKRRSQSESAIQQAGSDLKKQRARHTCRDAAPRSRPKADSSSRKSGFRSVPKEEAVEEAVRVHGLARQANFYGLIQEVVTPNVFRLLVATCLLNQTKGRAAMPVFWELLKRWPDEHGLAVADAVELTELLRPIGLHNIRANRLIAMAKAMVEIPYDEGNAFKSRDRTAPDTPIGIYPGVGRYAIDSWRIFVAGGGASVGLPGAKPVSTFDIASNNPSTAESVIASSTPSLRTPEWKSVMPLDKELRAYLVWRWAKEGCVWDPVRGVISGPCDLL